MKSIDLELSSSQYLSISDASQTGLDITGDITIEAWIKLESLPSAVGQFFVIASKNDISNNYKGYTFAIRNTAGGTAPANSLQFYWRDSGGVNTTSFGSTTALTTGVWYHVAAVADVSAASVSIYLNGSALTTETYASAATSISDNNDDFRIGAIANGASIVEYFDGLIDDVRVWSDIRTGTEIVSNFDKELLGTEANLVGYWKLNNSLLDETSNNNDLTNNGSAVFNTDHPPIYRTLGEYLGAGSATTKLLLHLNGNSTDSSGNGNNGTDTNITYSQANGKFGQGAGFNGSNSWITRANLMSATNTATISMWVKMTNFTNTIQAIGGISADNVNGSFFFYAYNSNSAIRALIRTNNNLDGVSASGLSSGVWYNLLATYDGSKMKYYVDSKFIGEINMTGNVGGNIPLLLGQTNVSNYNYWLNGAIDEVIVENRAWTASEVRKYYTNAKGRFHL